MKDIQYDKLIEKVTKDIEDRKLTYISMDFSDIMLMSQEAREYDREQFDEFVHVLETQMNVKPYEEIQGNVLARCIKKVIKKMTTFFQVPSVLNQNAYNNANLSIIRSLYWQMLKQEEVIKELKYKLELCEKEIGSLKNGQ